MDFIQLRRVNGIVEVPEGDDEQAISSIAHALLDSWFPNGDPADMDSWGSIAVMDAQVAVNTLKEQGLL